MFQTTNQVLISLSSLNPPPSLPVQSTKGTTAAAASFKDNAIPKMQCLVSELFHQLVPHLVSQTKAESSFRQ